MTKTGLRILLGRGQLYLSFVGMLFLVLSAIYTVIAAKSCFGLSCTSALLGLVVAAASLAISLLAIPAYGWLKGRRWALAANLVCLLPVVGIATIVVGIRHDIAQQSREGADSPQARTSNWSSFTRSTVARIESRIEEFSFGIQRVPGNEFYWRTAPPSDFYDRQPKQYLLITEEEAKKVLLYLADDGFFDRWHAEQSSPFLPQPGSYAIIHVAADQTFVERVPWTTGEYERNGAIRPSVIRLLLDLEVLIESNQARATIEAVRDGEPTLGLRRPVDPVRGVASATSAAL